MPQPQVKINANKGYQNANVASLMKLNRAGWTIDRFGHATKEIDGQNYRYKFQKRTVRQEVQVVHPASGYSSETKEWMRLKTARYTKDKA